MLKNGFNTGHGTIRQPQNIKTAANLACIVLQSNQNEMFGGQAFPTFDYDLAPYVAKSFISNFIKCLKFDDPEIDSKIVQNIKQNMQDYYDKHNTLIDEFDAIHDIVVNDYSIPLQDLKRCFDFAHQQTVDDTYQAMEAFVHNMNSMHSRCGAQTPFSSINYGTCITAEGRLITQQVLKATEAGLGHGETPIFPVQIFKMKKGVNWYPEDPNYDLMKESIKCSAKRLFPKQNWGFTL